MRELIKKWRKRGKKNAARIHYKYADELRAALPVWTKITDDPDTWPEDGNYLWAYRSVDGDWLHATFEVSMMRVVADMAVDTRWRPLADIDYPPENEDG